MAPPPQGLSAPSVAIPEAAALAAAAASAAMMTSMKPVSIPQLPIASAAATWHMPAMTQIKVEPNGQIHLGPMTTPTSAAMPFMLAAQQQQAAAAAAAAGKLPIPMAMPPCPQMLSASALAALPRMYINQAGQAISVSAGLIQMAAPGKPQQIPMPATSVLAASFAAQAAQIPVQLRMQMNGQQVQVFPHHLAAQQLAAAAAAAGKAPGGLVAPDLKPILTHMASTTPIHAGTAGQIIPPGSAAAALAAASQGAPLILTPASSSLRAAQLARYRQKRMVRLHQLSEGQKKIRYQCRKTLADARPRVKGRFAKVNECESPLSTSPKARIGKPRLTATMSAMDLTQLHGFSNQKMTQPKLEDDLEDINSMWWLGDGGSDATTSGDSTTDLLDMVSESDLRRCYSETNLLNFDSLDVQAAMEVLHTEHTFSSICARIHE